MPEYLVRYEVTEYFLEEEEGDDGEVYEREGSDFWEGAQEVEADSPDAARVTVYNTTGYLYDDIYVFSVEEV